MTRLADLPTPCAVLDPVRLENNIKTLADRMAGFGVALRPHLKTAKSIDVARICTEHGADRWTVSTLKEAEYFHANGLSDMLYTLSIVPQKAERIMAYNRDGAGISVCLDTFEGARLLANTGLDGPPLKVFLEIDVDAHRTGLRPDDTALIETGRVIADAPHLDLAGVMAHGGDSYSSRSIADIKAQAVKERETTVAAAEALREAGLPCPIVSIGSSPTAYFGDSFDGITEVRAGVYMFQDVFQANLGLCPLEGIAMGVQATVVSHSGHLNRLILDAGGLALSKDRSCASQENDCGYGFLTRPSGGLIPDLYIAGVSQEHGYVTSRSGKPLDFSAFPIGSKLVVLPNHACMTAAAYEGYHLTDGTSVQGWWPRINGW